MEERIGRTCAGDLCRQESREVRARSQREIGATLGTQRWPARHREGVPRKKVRGAGDRSQRKAMIETGYSKLSIRRQSALLGVNRNRLTSNPTPTTEEDRMIMCHLDELHTRWPFLGQRKLIRELRDQGIKIGRKRLRRLMRMMGIEAIVPRSPSSARLPKDTRSTPISCATGRSVRSTKSGARTSPTSQWRQGTPI